MSTNYTATRTVRLIPKLGTYVMELMPSTGELWQVYTSDDPLTANDSQIGPDYTTIQPRVDLLVTSSRVESGVDIPAEVKFYIGSELIGTASQSGLSSYSVTYATQFAAGGANAGMFEIRTPDNVSNPNRYAIVIKKNLVRYTAGVSTFLKAEAVLEAGTSSDTLVSTTPIRISRSTDSSSKVVIEAGDSYNFQILEHGQSCKLKAAAYIGTGVSSDTYTYQWYIQDPSVTTLPYKGWKVLTGKTSDVLTVTQDMVNATALFMVVVMKDGTPIGSDVQAVVDATDPLVIVVDESPIGATIKNQTDTVTFTAKIVIRKTGELYTDPNSSVTWRFAVYDPVGVLISNVTSGSSNTYVVTYPTLIQCSGVATVLIEADIIQNT